MRKVVASLSAGMMLVVFGGFAHADTEGAANAAPEDKAAPAAKGSEKTVTPVKHPGRYKSKLSIKKRQKRKVKKGPQITKAEDTLRKLLQK